MHLTRRAFCRVGLKTTSLGMAGLTANLLTAAEPNEDRIKSVHEDLRDASSRAELAMQFQGKTPDDARAWQKKFRAKLTELLGNFDPPAKWEVRTLSHTKLDGYTRDELLLVANGVPSLPVYVLTPDSATARQPAPAVLCVHGHGAFGHHPIVGRTDVEGVSQAVDKANYDYGRQFVERGYVVAAPCMIPFGVRVDRKAYGSDPCAVALVRMIALGKLPIAENLRDLRWAINLLESRPEAARGKIGCAGLSYGGRMTMLASAMDERIRVAAPSGAFNLLQERISHRYSCGAQVIPGLLKYGDYSEIGSLIAPRACVWEIGSRDRLISPEWAAIFRRRLERIYTAYGARKQLHFDQFEGGHRWNGEVAFGVFDKVLKS